MSESDGQAVTDAAAARWRRLAMRWRRALMLLDYDVPACLPGEPDACGGTERQHAAAYAGTLAAVVRMKVMHLEGSDRDIVIDTAGRAWEALASEDQCDMGHGIAGPAPLPWELM